MNTLSSALEEACRSLGVIPPGSQLPLGKWTEADLEGDPHGKGDARIKLFPDGEGGILYNWKTGEQQTFFANGVDRMTPEQKIAHQQEIAAARIRADAQGHADAQVVVAADALAPHQLVMNVLDASKRAGVPKLAFAAQQQPGR